MAKKRDRAAPKRPDLKLAAEAPQPVQAQGPAEPAAPLGGSLGNGPARLDDVIHAHRWILGREPNSPEEIANSARLGCADLRLRLLRSPEFADHVGRLGIAAASAISRGDVDRILPDAIPRLVFLHIPKTGGTTLHEILTKSLSGENICPERHNGLYHRRAIDLASYRLFSGHFDRNALLMIPGSSRRVVTLLRNPRDRLISVYRFLRAHSARLAADHGLELVTAARRYSFAKFLKIAQTINIASVDNTYLRAFGAALPLARWEGRAEADANLPLKDLGRSIEELLTTALEFIESLDCVGILEEFDASLRPIAEVFGIACASRYKILQITDALPTLGDDFDRVEPVEVTAEVEEELEKLTRFDKIIYNHGVMLLDRQRPRVVKPRAKRANRRVE